jgi:hypothetical protein
MSLSAAAANWTVANASHDPKAFILPSNIARRHMTAGQRAMAYARIYPEQEKRGRGNKSAKIGEFTGITHQRFPDARLIIEWAPDLVERGTVSRTRRQARP